MLPYPYCVARLRLTLNNPLLDVKPATRLVAQDSAPPLGWQRGRREIPVSAFPNSRDHSQEKWRRHKAFYGRMQMKITNNRDRQNWAIYLAFAALLVSLTTFTPAAPVC